MPLTPEGQALLDALRASPERFDILRELYQLTQSVKRLGRKPTPHKSAPTYGRRGLSPLAPTTPGRLWLRLRLSRHLQT